MGENRITFPGSITTSKITYSCSSREAGVANNDFVTRPGWRQTRGSSCQYLRGPSDPRMDNGSHPSPSSLVIMKRTRLPTTAESNPCQKGSTKGWTGGTEDFTRRIPKFRASQISGPLPRGTAGIVLFRIGRLARISTRIDVNNSIRSKESLFGNKR